MKIKQHYFKLILILQIIIYFLLSIIQLSKNVPFYFTNTDPAYEYMVNGINLIYGLKPGHADHPGSTLQWLLALTHQIYYSFFGHLENIKIDFVNYSENYAITYSLITITLYSSLLYLLSKQLIKKFESKTYILFPFILIVASINIFDQIINVKPENLLFFSSTLLLFAILYFENSKYIYTKIISYSFIFALGVSTKITFILLLPIILLIKTIIHKLIFILSFIIFSFFINFKLIGTFSVQWFINIFLNGGRYGEERKLSIYNLLINLNNLIIEYPVLLLLLINLIIILMNKNIRQNFTVYELKIFHINNLLLMSGILLIFKESLPRDFIFIIPFLALQFIIQIRVIFHKYINRFKLIKFLNLTTFIIITISLVFYTFSNKVFNFDFYKNISNFNNTKVLYEKFLHEKSQNGDIIISEYDAPTQYSALQFGNAMYGDSAVKTEVDFVYPNSLFIVGSNIFNGKVELIGCQFFPKFLKENKKIFVLTRSREDLLSRIDSSAHSFKWILSDQYISFKETNLDWKIYKLIKAECK